MPEQGRWGPPGEGQGQWRPTAPSWQPGPPPGWRPGQPPAGPSPWAGPGRTGPDGQPGQAAQAGAVPAYEADDLLVPGRRNRLRLRTRVSGALFGAVAVVGAGTGLSYIVASAGSGAGTPAGAVQAMVDAIGQGDFLGALDDLAPGERNALAPGAQDIVSQLSRLGILSPDATLGDVTGLDFRLEGYGTVTRQLTPTLASVTLTGGSRTEGIDPAKLPLGQYFRGLVAGAPSGQATTPQTGTTRLAAVEVSGRWYVSLGYSVALAALSAAGRSQVPPPGGVQAVGATTPQGAVQALLSSVSNLDLSALLADLDPGEMAALDAYAPDFLPHAQAALDSVRAKVSITFSDVQMTTEPVVTGTLVSLGPSTRLTVRIPGGEVEYAGGCLTEVHAGATRHECAGAGGQVQKALLADLPPPVAVIYQRLIDSHPATGLVTTEVGGRWYVSPTRTYLQVLDTALSEFEPSDVKTIIANASGIGAALGKLAQQGLRPGLPSGPLPQVGNGVL